MQVYNAFLKILKKNLPGISLYFIIFLVLTILLSGSGKDNEKTQFKQVKLSMCIINEDRGIIGTDLKNYLGTIHKLEEIKTDKDTLQDALYNREIDYILYIPEDFTDKIARGETKNILRTIKVPDGTAGVFADTQIEQYLSTLQVYLMADFSTEEAAEAVKQDLGIETKVEVPQGEKMREKEPAYYYFLYLPYIFICVVILGLAPILLAFQKKEIADRNNCSAMSLKKKNTQIILGCITFVCACLAMFTVLAIIIYPKFMFSVKGILSFINAAIFILIALALAFFLAQFAKNSNVLNMASNTIGLGFSFLGGVFVPQEVMGDKILQLAKFVPTYWYVIANEEIQKIEGVLSLPKEIYVSFGLEVAFAVAIFSIGLLITKRKQENR